MLELPATRAPRTAPSTNPEQPTRPTQRWTINSSSKSTDRNAANQPADQAGQSSQPGLSTKPVISLTIFTFPPTLPYPFSAYPTLLLILESKEKQKRVKWQAKEETLKFRHSQDFTAIKCSNKSKEHHPSVKWQAKETTPNTEDSEHTVCLLQDQRSSVICHQCRF
jgi:hypothetical protein